MSVLDHEPHQTTIAVNLWMQFRSGMVLDFPPGPRHGSLVLHNQCTVLMIELSYQGTCLQVWTEQKQVQIKIWSELESEFNWIKLYIQRGLAGVPWLMWTSSGQTARTSAFHHGSSIFARWTPFCLFAQRMARMLHSARSTTTGHCWADWFMNCVLVAASWTQRVDAVCLRTNGFVWPCA